MADNLCAKIRVVRATLQDFKKRLSTFSSLDKSLHDSEAFLSIQISDLDDEYKRVKGFHTDIIAIGDETEAEFVSYKTQKVFEAVQNVFFKHSTTLREYLKIVTKAEVNNATFLESTHRVVNFNPNSLSQNQSDLNYAYLNGLVPNFDGTYSKWPEFMDSYICNVHENDVLSDGSKVKILQSLLKGDAMKVVKREFGVLKTSEYNAIWEKLVKRYNHKRTIVYSYLKELCFQPNVEKETSDNLKLIYDTTYDSVSALKSMGFKTDDWGDLLLFLIYSKLPAKTKEIWNERHLSADTLPEFSKFLEFLENRFRTLEGLESSRKSDSLNNHKGVSKKVSTLQTTSLPQSCSKYMCKHCNKGSHALRKCFAFKKLKVHERIRIVNSLKYCTNCLSFSHQISNCTSEGRCEKCKEKHNSLLCTAHSRNNGSTPHSASPLNSESVNEGSSSEARLSHTELETYSSMVSEPDENESIVFPTALVKVISSSGQSLILRAMIDRCSDASYITENAVKRLNINVKRTEVQTTGLGNVSTASCIGSVRFTIASTTNSLFERPVSAYVLSLISPNRPVRSFNLKEDLEESIRLADPTFNRNARIDLLLGGLVDATIHKSGSFKCKNENIVFRETELGWIASGSIPDLNCFSTISNLTNVANFESLDLVLKSLDKSLRNFWEVEEIPNKRNFTKEEILCEEKYECTTKRLESGRYCVRLPFKEECKFVNMRSIALSRFSSLERKLAKDLPLKIQYVECMQEYLDLNHMTEVNHDDFADGYYIPHHCVLKASSSTTKLRVVFDASAKDASAQSLNENLFNGPRLQADILDHLIRFRTFKIAFTADIAKMYRQIIVHSEDRKFQLILWRADPSQEIRTYCLNTVTFGMKTAPYLAVKTLLRVAVDEKHESPRGSKCIMEGFYVDDFIYGADSVQEAIEIQSEVIRVLRSGGFHLRKWSSNSSEILDMVPETDRETKPFLDFDDKASVKTLGVQWSPLEDTFRYKFSFTNISIFTKRNVLSDIAKIFDPLGWISPCLIAAKLLLQRLWAEQKEWDEPLSLESSNCWEIIRSGLQSISDSIRIPRWLNSFSCSDIEVHGFSDASAQAYAVAIYLKSKLNGDVHVNLLCAKTKVAPLKQISIPRLELMAAVMLAKLVAHIKLILNFPNAKYFYWSDSQIALAWIRDSPHKRTVFVANRVTEIQGLSDPLEWRYVDTKSNPSDLGTRGIVPIDLPHLSLWWKGPLFLQDACELQSFQPDEVLCLPVEEDIRPNYQNKKKLVPTVIQTFLSRRKCTLSEISSNLIKFSFESLNKFSTLSKLIRVVAFCLRVLKQNRSVHKFITPEEYEKALLVLLRVVQEEVYGDEIVQIQSDELSKKNHLYSLNPFINKNDGLLRMTGRLQNAEHLNYDQRHPIILPHAHIITRLIVRHAHNSTLHGTEQQTMMLLTQKYHIIRCKSVVKSVRNKCVKCFRHKCIAQNQLMGQLPSPRVSPNRPFLHSGVDFAGPFQIKKFRGRCQSFYKAYFAIFVCFSTKAIHLEVVIDLSTSSFIAAFRRFIARRGLVRDLYSDCGKNFVGAQSVVTRKMAELESQWHEDMVKELAQFHTNWHFNPPGSPHFGGLWEAGVKSVKYHLKRIIGEARLTYDEFETVLIQVESCLNSRPLCAIGTNSDVMALTPGHFLIQDNLLALPDDNKLSSKLSQLERWNMLQKIVQDFWNVWSLDYLNTLRQRKKWKSEQNNVKVNDVVVLIDKNMPPNGWLLCKIIEVHPGHDGLVRVVTLKTKTSTLKRPITKICPLPVQEE